MIASLKLFLRGTLGLPPGLVLVAGGTGLHVLTCLLLGQPITWPWALLLPLFFSCALETYEIWDFYHDIGSRGPGRKPLHRILRRHAEDVGKVIAVPVLLVLVGVVFPGI